MRLLSVPLIALSCFAAPPQSTLTVKMRTAIPQAQLDPGRYTVTVVDALKDRKIVRVSDTTGRQVAMFLAAPNAKLARVSDGAFTFWLNGALRAWFIPGEAVAAEAVYEKEEALQLAQLSGQPVPAIDPETELKIKDRRLTRDDMNVLNLWVLDYGPVAAPERTLSAARLETVAWQPQRSGLPQTASPFGSAILAGALLLAGSLALRSRGR